MATVKENNEVDKTNPFYVGIMAEAKKETIISYSDTETIEMIKDYGLMVIGQKVTTHPIQAKIFISLGVAKAFKKNDL